jgi:hypothetical protein
MGPFLSSKQTYCVFRRTSPYDPDVWSGRALQENFVELAVSGLASMYPALLERGLLANHGYQRACDLISGKASSVLSLRLR